MISIGKSSIVAYNCTLIKETRFFFLYSTTETVVRLINNSQNGKSRHTIRTYVQCLKVKDLLIPYAAVASVADVEEKKLLRVIVSVATFAIVIHDLKYLVNRKPTAIINNWVIRPKCQV